MLKVCPTKPEPGSLIKLAKNQKETLGERVVGILMEDKFLFLFRKDDFEAIMQRKLAETKGKERRAVRRATAMFREIKGFRCPNFGDRKRICL